LLAYVDVVAPFGIWKAPERVLVPVATAPRVAKPPDAEDTPDVLSLLESCIAWKPRSAAVPPVGAVTVTEIDSPDSRPSYFPSKVPLPVKSR